MIERIYLDNIRTFVNFEWRPGPLAILLGANGAGKTALLDVLRGLQAFLLGEASSVEAFPGTSRTRWDQRPQQTVELDIRGNGGTYRYRLVVEHHEREPGKNRVGSETLRYDDRPLVEFADGELRLFGDEGAAGPRLKAKGTRSGVGAIEPGDDNRLLTWFKQWVFELWLLRPDPRAMRAHVETPAAEWLAFDLLNFGAWYLRYLTAKPGSMFKATIALGRVLPGFLELHERLGYLHARFGDDTASESFRFDELSDGQRALIALYVLRYAVAGPGKTLLIDEPDNYVSLREIQPWLTEMTDLALGKSGPQVWIISHHPEVLNLLAVDFGWRFFRDGTGPTRVERFQPATGLDPAETVARGWEDDA
ncbi:AAA family ATPase [Sorangium sp. So ce363]|uniref:AAA family ATPase n=1 Tax=Sorangium sp. So ce363 TaxID=3133304 RepID=UPI003F61D28F